MDTLFINNLKLQTRIGVHEWEQKINRSVFLDLELGIDNHKAAMQDHLSDTVDYAVLADRLQHYVDENHFQLVETLADKLCDFIQQEFNITQLKLKLSKPCAIPSADSVGVIVERQLTA